MGWKTIKEVLNCGHIVQVRTGNVIIGSAYVSELIVISPEGKIIKAYDKEGGWSYNEDLFGYMEILRKLESTGELKTLCEAKDVFGPLVDIYTFEDGRLLKKQCEVPEWPNCCTGGEMIYENTFFLERADAKAALLKDTQIALRYHIPEGGRNIREGWYKIGKGIGRICSSLWYYCKARLLNF